MGLASVLSIKGKEDGFLISGNPIKDLSLLICINKEEEQFCPFASCCKKVLFQRLTVLIWKHLFIKQQLKEICCVEIATWTKTAYFINWDSLLAGCCCCDLDPFGYFTSTRKLPFTSPMCSRSAHWYRAANEEKTVLLLLLFQGTALQWSVCTGKLLNA